MERLKHFFWRLIPQIVLVGGFVILFYVMTQCGGPA